jgi:hypothetical protein
MRFLRKLSDRLCCCRRNNHGCCSLRVVPVAISFPLLPLPGVPQSGKHKYTHIGRGDDDCVLIPAVRSPLVKTHATD